MTNFRFPLKLCFLWCLMFHRLRGRLVQQLNCCIYCFIPKPLGNTLVLHHTLGHLCDSRVLPLKYSILLWSVGCGKLSFDAVFSTKVVELFETKFTSMNKSKSGYVTTWLLFYQCFDLWNSLNTLDFNFRKYIHFFLLKISTNKRKCLHLLIDPMFISLQISAWTSFRTLLALQACLPSNGVLCCFPVWQAPHAPYICCWMLGIPSTKISKIVIYPWILMRYLLKLFADSWSCNLSRTIKRFKSAI